MHQPDPVSGISSVNTALQQCGFGVLTAQQTGAVKRSLKLPPEEVWLYDDDTYQAYLDAPTDETDASLLDPPPVPPSITHSGSHDWDRTCDTCRQLLLIRWLRLFCSLDDQYSVRYDVDKTTSFYPIWELLRKMVMSSCSVVAAGAAAENQLSTFQALKLDTLNKFKSDFVIGLAPHLIKFSPKMDMDTSGRSTRARNFIEYALTHGIVVGPAQPATAIAVFPWWVCDGKCSTGLTSKAMAQLDTSLMVAARTYARLYRAARQACKENPKKGPLSPMTTDLSRIWGTVYVGDVWKFYYADYNIPHSDGTDDDIDNWKSFTLVRSTPVYAGTLPGDVLGIAAMMRFIANQEAWRRAAVASWLQCLDDSPPTPLAALVLLPRTCQDGDNEGSDGTRAGADDDGLTGNKRLAEDSPDSRPAKRADTSSGTQLQSVHRLTDFRVPSLNNAEQFTGDWVADDRSRKQ